MEDKICVSVDGSDLRPRMGLSNGPGARPIFSVRSKLLLYREETTWADWYLDRRGPNWYDGSHVPMMLKLIESVNSHLDLYIPPERLFAIAWFIPIEKS